MGKVQMSGIQGRREGLIVTNENGGTPMGEVVFTKAGSHTLTVSLVEGDPKDAKLATLHLTPNE